MNEKDIIISRDKKNPTWVWVGNTESEVKEKKCKRILLDFYAGGCVCVGDIYDENYINNLNYAAFS